MMHISFLYLPVCLPKLVQFLTKMNKEIVKNSSSQHLRAVKYTQMHVKTIYKAHTGVIFESYWQVRGTTNIICYVRVCV